MKMMHNFFRVFRVKKVKDNKKDAEEQGLVQIAYNGDTVRPMVLEIVKYLESKGGEHLFGVAPPSHNELQLQRLLDSMGGHTE